MLKIVDFLVIIFSYVYADSVKRVWIYIGGHCFLHFKFFFLMLYIVYIIDMVLFRISLSLRYLQFWTRGL